MNFKNLIDAATLEVGYQLFWYAPTEGDRREAFFRAQVQELRKNSDFDTEAEYRLITADHVIEATSIKVWAYLQSLHADPETWVVVNSNNNYRIATYNSRGAASHAVRRARKENANYRTDNGAVVARRLPEHLRTKRGKLVQNLLSKGWVMENTHTPWTLSVQSETYWAS